MGEITVTWGSVPSLMENTLSDVSEAVFPRLSLMSMVISPSLVKASSGTNQLKLPSSASRLSINSNVLPPSVE